MLYLINNTKIVMYEKGKEMTKQEKMKIYKRRQIALVVGLAIVLTILIVAMVMIFRKDDKAKNDSLSASSSVSESTKQEKDDNSSKNVDDIPVDGGNKEDGSLKFEESEITLETGESYTATVINKTDESGEYIWESSNPSVATVDNGTITGQAEGSCDITVTLGEYTAKLRVYVEEKESNVVVENGITYIDGILIANKSYSLPSDYYPEFLPETQAAFDEMSADAAAEGLNLYISSGFRSYEYQSKIYNNYVARDGQAAADTYSARPGHSEHQTGLAFDLNTIDVSFENTPEYEWVAVNAHKYGFIVRYPKGKEDITGYIYEPWHLRYLGVEKATAVYESGLCLEEFLGIDSVYKD